MEEEEKEEEGRESSVLVLVGETRQIMKGWRAQARAYPDGWAEEGNSEGEPTCRTHGRRRYDCDVIESCMTSQAVRH